MKNTLNKFFSLKEAKEIWKAGQEYWKTSGESKTFEETIEPLGELLSDKQFTLEDMEAAVCFGMALHALKNDKHKLSDTEEFNGFIKDIKPTQWNVEGELIDNKFKITKILWKT